jgi:hypothetical protein
VLAKKTAVDHPAAGFGQLDRWPLVKSFDLNRERFHFAYMPKPITGTKLPVAVA